jgi:hypothetical protein
MEVFTIKAVGSVKIVRMNKKNIIVHTNDAIDDEISLELATYAHPLFTVYECLDGSHGANFADQLFNFSVTNELLKFLKITYNYNFINISGNGRIIRFMSLFNRNCVTVELNYQDYTYEELEAQIDQQLNEHYVAAEFKRNLQQNEIKIALKH